VTHPSPDPRGSHVRRARLGVSPFLLAIGLVFGAPTFGDALPASSAAEPATPAWGTPAQDPFFVGRVDVEANRFLLEIPAGRLDRDHLYLNTMVTGMGGSSPGVDRGQLGLEAVVRFERRGPRVLMVRDNWGVRALGDDEELARTVTESFPTSVIASFPVVEENGGNVVVDATAFFMGDIFRMVARIQGAGQGSYQVDRDRSWIDEEYTGSFPSNLEVRSVLTYTSNSPGGQINQAAPDGSALTMSQHHSLLALPDEEGFRPRPREGRTGLNSVSFLDFSQGLDGTYRDGYVARWRLVPSDPEAYLSGELVEPETPIVYYMDPGIPEPYRSAYFEGGLWWNEVFEAAGFRNAFQIRDLPAGANPMDARYPMIYSVHRRSPGPSVGPSHRDPRTGEILHTVVRMDTHRSLVDYNIYAGLLPAAGPNGLNVSAEDFAMARRRQHVAHEIGHTIGLAHNFIAAAQDRSSVMDYPAPLIELDGNGNLDLTRAYRESGGAWDTLAIRYAYTWYPDAESEAEGLSRILQDALDAGLRFVTGGHAGSAGSIPEATQWVEGSTMMEALDRTSQVRRLLVDRFNEEAIQPGEPMAMLNQRFAHVYLHHRYALEGAIKYVGGMEFSYAARGDGQVPARVLPAQDQRQALEMVLDALEPGELAIPDHIPDLIPPSPFGTDGSEIWIGSQAGPAFDPVILAGGLATEILEGLLHRERAARLVLFHARDSSNPSLNEVLELVVARSWGAGTPGTSQHQLMQRVVRQVVLNTLLDLAGTPQATQEVRNITEHQLELLRTGLAERQGGSVEDQAQRAWAVRSIDRYFAGEDDPSQRSRYPVIPLPWP